MKLKVKKKSNCAENVESRKLFFSHIIVNHIISQSPIMVLGFLNIQMRAINYNIIHDA